MANFSLITDDIPQEGLRLRKGRHPKRFVLEILTTTTYRTFNPRYPPFGYPVDEKVRYRTYTQRYLRKRDRDNAKKSFSNRPRWPNSSFETVVSFREWEE